MFQFKQFAIEQDRTPMKVGTDGVLIGAWATVEEADRHALDIGCGTGLIALMIAQRSGAMVDAVEIEKDSAEQARENIAASEWSERVSVETINIADFKQSYTYDLIVSNPPFFCDSLLSPDKGRTTARHTTMLSFAQLADAAARLLSPNGRFALILPPNESERFEREAIGKLYLSRRCLVKGRVSSDVKRVMSEYKLSPTHSASCKEFAIREAEGNEYSAEYRTLTKDFYLKF